MANADGAIDFLHPDNVCGRTLLSLVARGSAIASELLRLADFIPPAYLPPNSQWTSGAATPSTSAPAGSSDALSDAVKYAPVIVDFRYLKSQETYDEKIDKDTELTDLDEEFRENHFQILERFYKLFESVYRFIADWLTYLEELNEGVFVAHTVDSVLADFEGGQLMCEVLYLYGVMLLLCDRKIGGEIREKMIVSYYRYKGIATIQHFDEVCRLMRNSGYVRNGKRPSNYPEEFFNRFKLPAKIIELIIARLRGEDLYNHTQAFPDPSHRSIALANQASMLYVSLYFAPHLLSSKDNFMREVVDKFYPDNWVIPFYMGSTVDLADAWEPYKAAKAALKNTFAKANIEEIVQRQQEHIVRLNKELDRELVEGVLNEEYVLESIRKLMTLARECNFTLRWFVLHRTTTNLKIREVILKASSTSEVMRLLMMTAQFEFLLKSRVKTILDNKQSRWDFLKKESVERMDELSAFYSGERELARVKKNESLRDWFKNISNEINSMDFMNAILAGRKIAQLSQALEEVEVFHQIEASLQVKQYLIETRDFLKKMQRTVNVTSRILADLDIISDLSYAWEIIDHFGALMHEKIRLNPNNCLLLRATFLKLASILNGPLVRITQAESKDDVSVADYHSGELVKYVRKVLEIIPQSVFKILDDIIALLTNQLKPMPTKLERKYLRDFAQLDERYTLARATHQISVFTQGILSMHTTLLGIIKLDPRQLLEDGIRKELVRKLTVALHEYLVFRSGKLEDFEARLQELGRKLDGFRQAFEYIQDVMQVYGLKIWQEEFSRITLFHVEQETNLFLRKKIFDWQSRYQTDAIPIPIFAPIPHPNPRMNSMNFMGRLVRELMAQTDPRTTTYVESLQGWYDKDGREVVGIRTFSLLQRGVGIFGLTGLDRLICFMIAKDLTDFVKLMRRTLSRPVLQFLHKITGELHPTRQFPNNAAKLYSVAAQKTHKLWPTFLESVTRVGQAQLLRRQIANELNFTAKMDSKLLTCALEALNNGLTNDVQMHYARPADKPYPGNPVLPEISKYLETTGINNPITKIYITTEPLEGLPVLVFLFVLSQITKLAWNDKYSTLINNNKNMPLDGAPLVVGVVTLLKQFHSNHTHSFLTYFGQFIRTNVANMNVAQNGKTNSLPAEITSALLFLEEFCKFSHTSRKTVDALVPAYLFDRFDRTAPIK